MEISVAFLEKQLYLSITSSIQRIVCYTKLFSSLIVRNLGRDSYFQINKKLTITSSVLIFYDPMFTFFLLIFVHRINKPRLTEENWNNLYVVILFLFSCTFISHVKNIFSYLNSKVPSFSQENETLKFFLICLFHSISFSIPVLSYFLKSCAFVDSFTYFFSIR